MRLQRYYGRMFHPPHYFRLLRFLPLFCLFGVGLMLSAMVMRAQVLAMHPMMSDKQGEQEEEYETMPDQAEGEGMPVCRTSEEWQKAAEESCHGHCSKETGKCGVNSFSVGRACPENGGSFIGASWECYDGQYGKKQEEHQGGDKEQELDQQKECLSVATKECEKRCSEAGFENCAFCAQHAGVKCAASPERPMMHPMMRPMEPQTPSSQGPNIAEIVAKITGQVVMLAQREGSTDAGRAKLTDIAQRLGQLLVAMAQGDAAASIPKVKELVGEVMAMTGEGHGTESPGMMEHPQPDFSHVQEKVSHMLEQGEKMLGASYKAFSRMKELFTEDGANVTFEGWEGKHQELASTFDEAKALCGGTTTEGEAAPCFHALQAFFQGMEGLKTFADHALEEQGVSHEQRAKVMQQVQEELFGTSGKHPPQDMEHGKGTDMMGPGMHPPEGMGKFPSMLHPEGGMGQPEMMLKPEMRPEMMMEKCLAYGKSEEECKKMMEERMQYMHGNEGGGGYHLPMAPNTMPDGTMDPMQYCLQFKSPDFCATRPWETMPKTY